MITKEDLERKFTLKNKIVVTSPKGISTEKRTTGMSLKKMKAKTS